MRIVLCLFLFIKAFTAFAQYPTSSTDNDKISYNQYLKYTLGEYLNTSYSNLRLASFHWQANDTTQTIHYIERAIRLGLFDTLQITNTASLNSFTKTKYWGALAKAIETNRKGLQDVKALEIHTEDVERFMALYPTLIKSGGDSVLWTKYITGGSHGLRTFFNVRMSSRADVVVNAIRKRQKFYKSLQPLVAQLSELETQLKKASQQLEWIYPEAIHPPIYLVIGNFAAAGTPDGGAGILIGMEFFSNYKGQDTSELTIWEKNNISDTNRFLGLVIHEMMHIQQQHAVPSYTLLGRAIVEGGAEFLTFLTLNKTTLPRQFAYGDVHEIELYKEFEKEMNTTNLSNWMYNAQIEDKGIPSDLGYYIGFKICEAYYNNQTDKKKAIKDILEIKDFQDFFQKSRYSEKFE